MRRRSRAQPASSAVRCCVWGPPVATRSSAAPARTRSMAWAATTRSRAAREMMPSPATSATTCSSEGPATTRWWIGNVDEFNKLDGGDGRDRITLMGQGVVAGGDDDDSLVGRAAVRPAPGDYSGGHGDDALRAERKDHRLRGQRGRSTRCRRTPATTWPTAVPATTSSKVRPGTTGFAHPRIRRQGRGPGWCGRRQDRRRRQRRRGRCRVRRRSRRGQGRPE